MLGQNTMKKIADPLRNKKKSGQLWSAKLIYNILVNNLYITKSKNFEIQKKIRNSKKNRISKIIRNNYSNLKILIRNFEMCRNAEPYLIFKIC